MDCGQYRKSTPLSFVHDTLKQIEESPPHPLNYFEAYVANVICPLQSELANSIHVLA